MDATLQVSLGAAEGAPQAGARSPAAAPDSSRGPASFLSVLDQALAAQPLAPEQAQPPPSPPQEAAPPHQPATDKPQAVQREVVGEEKAKRPKQDGKEEMRDGSRAEGPGHKKEAPADRSATASREELQPGEPKQPVQAACEQAPVEGPQALAEDPNQPSQQPGGGRASSPQAARAQAAPRPVQSDSAKEPAEAAAQPVAAQALRPVQEQLPGPKATPQTPSARKAPPEGPAAAGRAAEAPAVSTAAAQPAPAASKPGAAQVQTQEGEQGEGRPEAAQSEQAAPQKAPAQPRQAARQASGELGKKSAQPAPTPHDAAPTRTQATLQTHAQPLQPGADAVAVQAWRRYDVQAGEGYRQQVQTLAGRATGQMAADIIRQAQYVRQNGSTAIRMQLNPPEMGRIRLEVRMRFERLEVRMQVENPEVRQAMTRELAGLDRTLRDAQVDVQRFEVTDYQTGGRSPERGAPQEGSPSGGRGPDIPATGEQDSTAVGWARISTSGAVDCLI